MLYQAIWASVALRPWPQTARGNPFWRVISYVRVQDPSAASPAQSGSLVSRWPRDARDCSYGTRSRLIDRFSRCGFISGNLAVRLGGCLGHSNPICKAISLARPGSGTAALRVTLRFGRDPRMHEVAHSGGRPRVRDQATALRVHLVLSAALSG